MWVRVYNTAANGVEPVRNVGNDVLVYTMTSVGLDLWLLGGIYDDYGEGDSCSSLSTLMWLLY
jgi:hypothetical protein